MLRWMLQVWLGLGGWWSETLVAEKEGGYIDPSGRCTSEAITALNGDL